MEGLDGRPEPQMRAARKGGGILARSKWQGETNWQEGFGDVTVTPREASIITHMALQLAGMARPGPKLSKLQGFPISSTVPASTGQQLGLHTVQFL